MSIDEYINITKKKLVNKRAQELMIKQINAYYNCKNNYKVKSHNYKIGDYVKLKKGTLLHGTYKNIEGLREIVNDGLISSWFISGRGTKYPSSVGVWNLKKDYMLKDYINFYSGGTYRFFNQLDKKHETGIIPFDKMKNINKIIKSKGYLAWGMEQTKEARFMPSLVQNEVQIGIIFNGKSVYAKKIKEGDILNNSLFNDRDVKEFVNEAYYDRFLIDRKNKDDFFTDRESAILFGIPSNMIEGILVGRKYERNKKILEEIKSLLPNCYICNLDGKVILC